MSLSVTVNQNVPPEEADDYGSGKQNYKVYICYYLATAKHRVIHSFRRGKWCLCYQGNSIGMPCNKYNIAFNSRFFTYITHVITNESRREHGELVWLFSREDSDVVLTAYLFKNETL